MTEKEINLVELISFLWKKKFKILLISFSVVIIVITHNYNKKIFFKSTTELKPISAFEESKYKAYNSYLDFRLNKQQIQINFNQLEKEGKKNNLKENLINSFFNQNNSFEKIDKDYLMTLFIDKLRENEILTRGIKKFNFLNQNNFNSEMDYNNAVKKIASSINIVEVKKLVKKTNIVEKEYKIFYETDDKEKWEEFLKYIETEANHQIKLHLSKLFKEIIAHENKMKTFEIEDYESRITNLRDNYAKTISRRLDFLREQAQIARRLKIPKNNLIEAQTFATDTGIIANLRTEIPYYMRGYEMIEEEIMLIENRKNTDAFIQGLNKLEQSKEAVSSNKDLERIEILYSETPILDDSIEFKAGNIMFLRNSYTSNNLDIIKVTIIAFIIGFIFAVIYVLVENAIRSKNNQFSKKF